MELGLVNSIEFGVIKMADKIKVSIYKEKSEIGSLIIKEEINGTVFIEDYPNNLDMGILIFLKNVLLGLSDYDKRNNTNYHDKYIFHHDSAIS